MSSKDTLDHLHEAAACVVCGPHAVGNATVARLNRPGHTVSVCGTGCMEEFRHQSDSYLVRLRKPFDTWQLNKRNRETLPTSAFI